MAKQKSALLALPDELLLEIADRLEARHVNRLILTCKHMEDKLTGYLYRQFHEQGKALIWAGKTGYRRPAQYFLEHMPDHHPIKETGYKALVKACKHGHAEIIRMLLEVDVPRVAVAKDAAPDAEADWKKQPLVLAIKNYRTDIIRLLVQGSERLPLPEPQTLDMVVSLLDMGTHFYEITVAQMLIAKGLHVHVKGRDDLSVLHRLAAQGQETILRLLLLRGMDINMRTSNGHSPLYYAILSRQSRVVEMLLDAGADIQGNNNGTSHPLTAAITVGDLRIVKQLLNHGVPVQCPVGLHRQTPLHVASYRGAVSIGMYLVEQGASCQAQDTNGKSPLDYAMAGGKLEAVRLLVAGGYADTAQNVDELLVWAAHLKDYPLLCHALRKGADPIGVRDRQGQTALHIALQPLDELLVTRLLNAGAPINLPDQRGQTPLMHAAGQAAVPLMTRLLSRVDAHAPQIDVFRRTALHHAILGNNLAVVPALLHWAPALLECPDLDGLTPLLEAIMRRNAPMVRLLLQHGACPNVHDRHGVSSLYWAIESREAMLISDLLHTLRHYPAMVMAGGQYSPIHRASLRGDLGLVRMLVAAGASCHTLDHLDQTLLMHAARRGDLWMTEFWLNQGANIEARDAAGQTALFHAIQGRQPEVVQQLLAWGAKVNILNARGFSPLHSACLQGDMAIVSQLRTAKANGHLHGENVRKPILMAAYLGQLAAVQMLAEQGGWNGVDTRSRRSALSLAAEGGHVAVVRFFLSQRLVSDINATDRAGRTALSWGVQGGNPAVVQLLVQAGADVTKADQEGHTPLWWAQQAGHEDVMRYLTGGYAMVDAMEEMGGELMEVDG